MKMRLKGSYTVEAAFVMAIVIWSMVVCIQAAYRIRDETVGAMALQEAVEQLRHAENPNCVEAAAAGEERAGHPFSWSEYQFKMELTGGALTGNKVQASATGGKWGLDIKRDVFDPENFLRKLTLFDREE